MSHALRFQVCRQDESLGPARRDHMIDDTYVIAFFFRPSREFRSDVYTFVNIIELLFSRQESRFDPDPSLSSMEVATSPSYTGPRPLRREFMTLSIFDKREDDEERQLAFREHICSFAFLNSDSGLLLLHELFQRTTSAPDSPPYQPHLDGILSGTWRDRSAR